MGLSWGGFALFLAGLVSLVFTQSLNEVAVRVELVGDVATGYVDGVPVATLFLESRAGDRHGLLLRKDEYPQAWDGWVVRDYWTGASIEADAFHPDHALPWEERHWPLRPTGLHEATSAIGGDLSIPRFGIALSPMVDGPEDVILEARLRRGMDAGIVVACDDDLNGYAFVVRPRRTDCYWIPLEEGRSLGPVPDSGSRIIPGYRHSLANIGWLAGVNLLAGWGYWLAAGLLSGGLLALGIPFGARLGRAGESLRIAWTQLDGETQKFLYRLPMIALLFFVFLLTRHIAAIVLERIPHVQDSIATLFQARIFARGALTAPAPSPLESFNFEMLVAFGGNWHSKYTIGHSLIMVPFVWLGDPYLLGPVMATGTLPAVYLLGRWLWGHGTGLLGAALLAFSPFFLIMSGSFMAHTSTLFWLAWFHTLVAVCWRRLGPGPAIAAGLCLGMAGISRPFSGLLCGLPAVAPLALAGWRSGRRGGFCAGMFLAGALIPVSLQLGFNASAHGDALAFGYQVYSPADQLGFGDKGWLGGHSPLQGAHNILLNLLELLPHLWGWPFWMGIALVAIPLLSRQRSWWDVYLFAQWIALAGGYYFWWYHGIAYGPRFWYECVSCLALLSARGVMVTAHWWARAWEDLLPRGRDFARPVAMLGAATVPLALILGGTLPYLSSQLATVYRGYNFTDALLLREVEAAGLDNAVVFVERGQFWSEYGVAFSQNSPWLDSAIVYAHDTTIENNRQVMEQYPGRVFYFWNGEELAPFEGD